MFGLVLALLTPAWGAAGIQLKPWRADAQVSSLAVTDVSGRTWQLGALKGRAVLLNFWASWCEPCVTEMPSLQALAAQQGSDRLLVLAVNFKQSLPTIDAFVHRSGLSLPVIADLQGIIARQWGIKIFPSTVLIDAQGRVHGILQGELD
ncbi:MAG: hypothetical protein AUK50_01520 [Comamonadaceae bacterium CG2_30_57_122]|nr:MAG: hypothetical protein AUK50_01520 [Comamonadaceae bacterium CG2_30_57_122]